jgi:hypothetical protein
MARTLSRLAARFTASPITVFSSREAWPTKEPNVLGDLAAVVGL